ncbi:MAG: MmgE/PrpD family protein [Roseovarius sp.]|nr:MmgE/PrpD family protein [Roseovarius sp.]
MKPTLATHLAAFICGLEEDTLPADVTDKARTCLLNGFGIGYAGLGTPYHVVAARTARAMYGDGGDATLLADGTQSTISGAVLANGALFHGRAQEDTCGAAHLGAVMIPLLTALIETGRAATDDLIPSLVAGYEAGGVFEELLAIHSTPVGFRATTV